MSLESRVIVKLPESEAEAEKLAEEAARLGVKALLSEKAVGFKPKVTLIAPEGGDLRLAELGSIGDVVKARVESSTDIEEAAEACTRAKALLIEAESWRVVPAENIIAAAAGKCEVYAEARDMRDAISLLSALERGVDAIVLAPESVGELRESLRQLRSHAEGFLKLEEAEVTCVQETGLGDRACIDTALLLSRGEGMLVGSKASLLFLVHSETLENPFIEPRPFRVNAGAVHSYILSSLHETRYLSELKGGSSVLAVSWRGRARRAIVGRVKIEKRSMLLVEAEASGEAGTVLLQDAETVCLVSPSGEAVSVRELEEGSKVLVHKPKAKARHAGMAVEEFLLEK